MMALVSMRLESLHKSTAQACLKGNNFVISFHNPPKSLTSNQLDFPVKIYWK